MKKIIYAMALLLVVISGLVFTNCETKNETSGKSVPKQLSSVDRKAELKKWEATPDGISFLDWKASPQGIKVLAGAAKINKYISATANMEAVVTSLSLPPGSRLGFGMMVRIDGDDYILRFDPQKSQLEQLRSLKVSDKVNIKSHAVSYAPKYAYPIIAGDYVERDGKIIYKRVPQKDGC